MPYRGLWVAASILIAACGQGASPPARGTWGKLNQALKPAPGRLAQSHYSPRPSEIPVEKKNSSSGFSVAKEKSNTRISSTPADARAAIYNNSATIALPASGATENFVADPSGPAFFPSSNVGGSHASNPAFGGGSANTVLPGGAPANSSGASGALIARNTATSPTATGPAGGGNSISGGSDSPSNSGTGTAANFSTGSNNAGFNNPTGASGSTDSAPTPPANRSSQGQGSVALAGPGGTTSSSSGGIAPRNGPSGTTPPGSPGGLGTPPQPLKINSEGGTSSGSAPGNPISPPGIPGPNPPPAPASGGGENPPPSGPGITQKSASLALVTGEAPEEEVDIASSLKPPGEDTAPREVTTDSGIQVSVRGQAQDLTDSSSLITVAAPDGSVSSAQWDTDKDSSCSIFPEDNRPVVRMYFGTDNKGPWQEKIRKNVNRCGQTVEDVSLADKNNLCSGYLRFVASYSIPVPANPDTGAEASKNYFRAEKILGCGSFKVKAGEPFPYVHALINLELEPYQPELFQYMPIIAADPASSQISPSLFQTLTQPMRATLLRGGEKADDQP